MSSTSSDSISSIRSKPPGEKWLFSEDQLQSTPSRRDNVPPAKELNYRQQAANLIQDMGQRLPVNQLTINTAIVYMHRFYMFHSFQAFSRFLMAPTALFLAAKVEEQPRKLEHVIRVCHSCLHPDKPHLDVHSDNYLKQAQQLVEHELLLLQTLGFDISIDHPHTHVVKCTQLVKASRDLSQMAYFMATNSLHLTTFCLKYKPTVVSAMCIHLSCKWSNYEIPLSSEGKAYWTYMDPTITEALLENIINEFLKILNLCPTRLRKLRNYKPSSRDGSGGSTPQSKDGHQPKPSSNKSVPPGSQTVSSQAMADTRRPGSNQNPSELQKKPSSLTIAEYKHKREKELQSKHTENSTTADLDKEKSAPKPPSGTSQNAPSVRPGHSSAPKQPSHRSGNSDVRPPAAGSGGPHATVKTEQTRHPEKVHPKQMAGHKRSDRSTHHGQKAQSGLPSGIPGLQKPKHPTHQGHGTASQAKERSKIQQQRLPHAPHNKPREVLPPKTKDHQTSEIKNAPGHHVKSSTDLDENLLAGMEQKVMEQIKAEKARELTAKTVECPVTKPQVPHPSHNSSAKDPKTRHSMPDLPSRKELAGSHTQPPIATKSSYKILYEQYKKNPEALRHQLKQKAATEPLNEEEKQIWHKLKKKEEDRLKKKRKHEKHKFNRSQPIESNSGTEAGNVTPGGGPLTVRIKLPPSVRAEISKSQPTSSSGTGVPLASSSGSGSEPAMSSPGSSNTKAGRKRTHTHEVGGLSDPISAKHSRKSEGHHHQSHHSSHDSSRHRHRHGRSSAHHQHHSKSHHQSHKIDEATFQQALSNAVSMVQSGQASSSTNDSGNAIPTVTLKRTGVQNGSGDNYVAQSSRPEKHKASRRSKQLGFDPSAPVSATPPEDLFDADEGDQQKPENREAVSENADVSSPETGEIIDDDERGSPLSNASWNRSGHQSEPCSRREHPNNNNSVQERWGSSSGSGSYANPPLLSHQNVKHDGRKTYDNRLPPLTVKPNRTDQR